MRSCGAALSTPFCLVVSRSLTEARKHVLHTHQGNAASIGEGSFDIRSMCWVVTTRVKSEARLELLRSCESEVEYLSLLLEGYYGGLSALIKHGGESMPGYTGLTFDEAAGCCELLTSAKKEPSITELDFSRKPFVPVQC